MTVSATVSATAADRAGRDNTPDLTDAPRDTTIGAAGSRGAASPAGLPGDPRDDAALADDLDAGTHGENGDDGDGEGWPSSPFACVDTAFAALTTEPDPLRIDLSHLD